MQRAATDLLRLALAATTGCMAAPPGELVDNTAWVASAPDDLIEGRTPCTWGVSGGLGVEDGVLEVDTGTCDEARLTQPARIDVDDGAVLRVSFLHANLAATQPASATPRPLRRRATLVAREVPIPHPARAYREDVRVPSAIATGATVTFELDNHGSNTWKLLSIVAQPEDP